MAIINDNRIGNYYVVVIANVLPVAGFQVRDLENAQTEAARIREERASKGLPTASIFARQVIGRTRKRGLQLNETRHEL